MQTTHVRGLLIPAMQPRHRQRGIATVLITLLIGLSLTTTVLGTMYYLRATQDQVISVHAQTQAQMKAWTGVDLTMGYLTQLQKDDKANSTTKLVTLATAMKAADGAVITFDGVNNVSVKGFDVDSTSAPTLFTFDVVGTTADGTRASASSTIRAVYKLQAVTAAAPAVLTFNRNLKLGGSVTVQKNNNDTKKYEINVLGDVLTEGNSIIGVQKINSEGSINIGSGSSFEELNANCDIRLSGSVSTLVAKARRNACFYGNGRPTVLGAANGSIYAEAGFSDNNILAARTRTDDLDPLPVGVVCRAPGSAADNATNAAQVCPAPAITGVDLDGGGAGAVSVRTPGSVRLGRGGRIGTLTAGGNLTVGGGGVVNSGTVGGTVTPNNTPNVIRATVTVGDAAINLASTPVLAEGRVTKVPTVSLAAAEYDAYEDELAANYVFKVDANNFRKVTVRNVSGIAPGEYFLGNYTGGGFRDYLCTALANGSTPSSPNCSVPAVNATKTICKGFSPFNTCFSYNSSTQTWQVEGLSMAQGVAWFEGNLNVSSGTYYSTFIATRNITTSGQHVNYAPNFAGYSGVQGGITYAPTGICTNANFPDIYPTQFCNTATTTYDQSASGGIGNYVYKAGSIPPGTVYSQANYRGGVITLGSSTVAYGNVLAGNEFVSGGNTTIHGFVSALARGVKVNNSLGGSTTFDVRKLPPSFTPTTPQPPNASGGGALSGVTLAWSRHL